MNKSTSNFLNFSRWVAAFLVVVSHARSITLVDYQKVGDKNIALQAMYFVSGLGHEAVIVFFVISGFLVGGTTLASWKTGGMDVRAYAAARVSRIYTVLIPALVVGGALDAIGMSLFNQAGFYSTPLALELNSLSFQGQTGLSPSIFVANLLQMQGIWTGTYGTNGPLWSLAYECWYYLLFASLIGLLLDIRLTKKTAFAVITTFVICFLPTKVLLWGLIWATGSVTYAFMNKLHVNIVAAVTAFLTALTFSRLNLGHDLFGARANTTEWQFIKDFTLGLTYSVLIIAMQRCDFGWLTNINRLLAEFSYSVYVFHFPAMVLLASMMYAINPTEVIMQPGYSSLARLTTLCIAPVLLSYSLSHITERYTPQVRRWLIKKISQSTKVINRT